MIGISDFGIKIKNISACQLYEVNKGIRDYFTYTDAMLNNSLFSDYLKEIGMNVYKGSTRDIVCLDYDFGSKSYDEEIERINNMIDKAENEDLKDTLRSVLLKAADNREKYEKKKADEIRNDFYENGVTITYKEKLKNSVKETTIHYEMLFRTSAKAKVGQVIFINSNLYGKAYDWLTMGLGKKLPLDDAKIVELSAYAPLTTSTIVGKIHIPVEDVLILKDKDSFFTTLTKTIKTENYIDSKSSKRKKCVVEDNYGEVKNTLWDGMALIEADILPSWCNGMALLREHMFKSCAFKAHLQLFFKDWCSEHNYDYETYKVQDMFGKWHYLKDIKIITTDNSIKWKKFSDLMGKDIKEAYEYWCEKINENKSMWGIVKTDHPSKLGEYQQLSYQMINTLPCTKKDIQDICKTTIDYVELLKKDNVEFEKYLRKNANEVNNYDMLVDLYRHNKEFANSTFFRREKKYIINQFVEKMRMGKIWVNGDNLTVCGNPYALLLYSVGDDYEKDPTLLCEKGTIQCYTTRFDNDEYLAAFRNPHNSPNNICYLHNVHHNLMRKYFPFSRNVIAVNCINTDIQSRANGMDEDSDFLLVTNQPNMIQCAKICYEQYPTIVNAVKESGITYKNTKSDYAMMDNKFSKSRMDIGYSSNLAQLAMTYYWTELQKESQNEKKLKELYDNFVILSVVAQIVIDGCKREYEIDAHKEIDRICKMPCMTLKKTITTKDGKTKTIKNDFPEFMLYTRKVKCTKNGKELPYEIVKEQKDKLKSRINYDLSCPMNWLEECLNKIQNASTSKTTDTSEFFIKHDKKADSRKMSKVTQIIEDYSKNIDLIIQDDDIDDDIYNSILTAESDAVCEKIQNLNINEATMNRLIETALKLKIKSKKSTITDKNCKYTRRILNILYKSNKERFLNQFKKLHPSHDFCS